MISSQYGTEFEGSSYQKIKKVYSIWICTDVPKNRKNTINHYRMTEHYMVGKAVEKPENYDLINIVMLCLGDPESKKANRILRLFSKILLTEGNAIEKKRFLEEEYGIKMTSDLGQEVDTMCNLSEGIEQRGIEKGIEKGTEEAKLSMAVEMLKANLSMELIERVTKLPPEVLRGLTKQG